MSTFQSSEAKLTLRLDVDEAKEKLRQMKAEMAKAQQGRGAGLAPASRPGGSSPAPRAGQQTAITQRIVQNVQRTITNRIQGAVPGLGAASRLSQAIGGPNLQNAASFTSATSAGSGLLRALGTAAAVYGAARIGTTAGVGINEAAQSMFPELLEKNPVFQAQKELIENLSKKLDDVESRVIAGFVAAKQTKDITSAAAQLSGQIPNVGYYFSQEYDIARQSRNLDLAFDRFKYKGMAGAIGNSIREMTRGTLER